MQLAVVQGRATTTVRHCSLASAKLLICQPLGAERQPSGDPVLAVDKLGAGAGDKVVLTSDGYGLRTILNNAVQDYNEKLKSNALLMNRREELREFGFGRYMESEMQILIDYDKKNKDMQKQIADMQLALDRLRSPQDHSTAIQRLQSDNDWLKERMVSLEKESATQIERAHSIISELTTQLSDQRKLLESFRPTEEQGRKRFRKK